MSRSFTYQALVLKTRSSGESNRDAWFLTAEEGLIRATVFGGPKSKLRAHISPFNRGTLWIYHDPVRDSRKVSDFDVRSWRPGLRELYERTMAADALADTILASHGGGGNWEEALSLADSSLDALENADETLCVRIFIHFLWNWANILGLRPDPGRCGSCGENFAASRDREASAREAGSDGLSWYDQQEGVFLCSSCAGRTAGNTGGENHSAANGGSRGLLPLNAGARRWLSTVEGLNPPQLARYSLDAASLGQAKAVLTAIMAGILGKRLGTWDW
ncbi:recombinase RecO [Spirochaetia bacterium]|nr:recombinase RecO [Spirochaetia bacterium]